MMDFLEYEGTISLDQLSPLVLAYVGDAVYELFIRTRLVARGEVNVNRLHNVAVNFVQAKAQAELVRKLAPVLTEEEMDIVRRGRNAKAGHVPKNAEVGDYRYSTGFEALLGYLYLTRNMQRLHEILQLSEEENEEISG